MLDRIGQAGLIIKLEKCHVEVTVVQYLGYRVGVLEAATGVGEGGGGSLWSKPQTKTRVQAFLGILSQVYPIVQCHCQNLHRPDQKFASAGHLDP